MVVTVEIVVGAKSGGGMWHTAMCCHGGRGAPKLLYINPTCGPIKTAEHTACGRDDKLNLLNVIHVQLLL